MMYVLTQSAPTAVTIQERGCERFISNERFIIGDFVIAIEDISEHLYNVGKYLSNIVSRRIQLDSIFSHKCKLANKHVIFY